ncbi:MAG: SET domain-containing protein [Phycisphaerales bacterium]|nr:SET domain-containing protein [Phycisphaerales bacterium]
MLLVHARVGPSKIHGLGLLAADFIPRGTIVWEFRPGFDLVFTSAEMEALPPHARAQVRFYCDGDYDPATDSHTLSGDDARFTNHSDDANTASAESGRITVAVRDIEEGEEITWDYRSWGSALEFASR